MLSTDLATQIRTLLVELDSSEDLFNGLGKLAELENQATIYLDLIAKGGIDLQNGASQCHVYLANARQVLREIRPRNLYLAIERTTSALKSFHNLCPGVRLTSVSVVKRLEQFTMLFEEYLVQQTGPLVLPVLQTATVVLEQLQAIRSTLNEVLSDLESDQEISDEEEIFGIYFDSAQDLTDLAEKLNAIAEILHTVASLGPSSHYPSSYRVLRIESGSLMVKLALAKWMGGIIRPWLSALTSYFYRTRTIEGALTASGADANAAIKQVLDIRQLLTKAGISTSDMDKKIEEAATAMAKNVAVLVRNQIRMKVGDQDFEGVRLNNMLEYEHPKKLPPPTDSTSE